MVKLAYGILASRSFKVLQKNPICLALHASFYDEMLFP